MAMINMAIMIRSSHVMYSMVSPPFVSSTKEGKDIQTSLESTPRKQPPLNKSDMTEVSKFPTGTK